MNEEELRQRALENIEKGSFTIESTKKLIEHEKKVIAIWESEITFEKRYIIATAKGNIRYYEMVLSILEEQAIEEEAKKVIEETAKPAIKAIRKVVVVMANKLHKLGYSLSEAFKRGIHETKSGCNHKSKEWCSRTCLEVIN